MDVVSNGFNGLPYVLVDTASGVAFVQGQEVVTVKGEICLLVSGEAPAGPEDEGVVFVTGAYAVNGSRTKFLPAAIGAVWRTR